MLYKLNQLTNNGMLDRMLQEKTAHDNNIYGSYLYKWQRWIRSVR